LCIFKFFINFTNIFKRDPFEVQLAGEWRLALASVPPETNGLTWTLAPRSIVVLER
jgi:hypothetical protein